MRVNNTMVAGKQPSLLMAGNNDEVYDKKFQRYAKDNKQHLIVRSDKSVAYVTNNKRLY